MEAIVFLFMQEHPFLLTFSLSDKMRLVAAKAMTVAKPVCCYVERSCFTQASKPTNVTHPFPISITRVLFDSLMHSSTFSDGMVAEQSKECALKGSATTSFRTCAV
nr:hypothetical protein [Tanacetum cinerariifolium]